VPRKKTKERRREKATVIKTEAGLTLLKMFLISMLQNLFFFIADYVAYTKVFVTFVLTRGHKIVFKKIFRFQSPSF
jgi:hypothetical protein